METEEDKKLSVFTEDPDATVVCDTGGGCGDRDAGSLRRALGMTPEDRLAGMKDIAAIGIGGIGAVFSVKEPGLNREVALKVLRPQYRNREEQVKRFVREARITARIGHPNVVPVHRLGVFEDAGVYFTMERIHGVTLQFILKKLRMKDEKYTAEYPLVRLLEIFIGICNAAAFAHSRGIIHCDLKPGNIMVGDYGEIMVMDWGMARYMQDIDRTNDNEMRQDYEQPFADAESDAAVPEKETGGTPAFMAPELLAGRAVPGISTDIYSLGAILYTILVRSVSPFPGASRDEVAGQALRGRIKPVRRAAPRGVDVPRELEAVCRKAMAPHPFMRYADVGEILQDIRNYLNDFPVRAYSPNPVYRFMKFVMRHPTVPVVLAAAVLTLLGYRWYLLKEASAADAAWLSIADYCYEQGNAGNAYLLNRIGRLPKGGRRSRMAGGVVEKDIVFKTDETRNLYHAALEFISRCSGDRRMENAADIFKKLLRLEMLSGDDDELRRRMQNMRIRWNRLFNAAMERDPMFADMVRRINSGTGRLTVRGDAGLPLVLFDDAGNEEARGVLPLTLKITAGVYTAEVTVSGGSYRFPVRSAISGDSEFTFRVPLGLPDEVCAVPGSNIKYGSTVPGAGLAVEKPFMISKYEVTVGRYLEFWLSLPPEERPAHTGYMTMPDGVVAPLWDDSGKLNGGLVPEQPVFGIGYESARRFCRWYGERTGLVCRLPEPEEWQKAARGVDRRAYVWGNEYIAGRALLSDSAQRAAYPFGAPAGSFKADCSPFGVMDLNGNLREMTGDHRGGMFTVLGGSYASPPESALLSSGGDQTTGGQDVGFRFVLEYPAAENPAGR